MLTAARRWLALTTAAMALGVLALTFGAGGPEHLLGRTLMGFAFAGGVLGTGLWLWRWPSHSLSLAYTAVTTLSIACACLAYPDPLAAMLGCIAFATIVSYAAFFHWLDAVLGVLAVVTLVAAIQVVALAEEGRLVLAAVDLFLVLQCCVGVALAFHSLVRTLRGDLATADLDPLTGLLNRRAFRAEIGSRLSRRRRDGRYLLIALLDLDDFKSINDAHGHAVGDQALSAVAEALRDSAPPTAVIARSGGEEFLMADFVTSHTAAGRYEQICGAVADLPVPVTASIGTSLVDLGLIDEASYDDVIDRLIVAADEAMYHAKHNGGNRCHHHGLLL